MEIRICKDRYALGKSAAEFTAQLIREAIKEKDKGACVFLRLGV